MQDFFFFLYFDTLNVLRMQEMETQNSILFCIGGGGTGLEGGGELSD